MKNSIKYLTEVKEDSLLFMENIVTGKWSKVFLVYRGGVGYPIELIKKEQTPTSCSVCHQLLFVDKFNELVYSFDYNMPFVFHGFRSTYDGYSQYLNRDEAIFYVKKDINMEGNIQYNLFQKELYENRIESGVPPQESDDQ